MKPNTINAHRASNIFEALLPHVLEGVGQLVAHLIAHYPADADITGLCQCFEPSGYVNTVAKDVLGFDDNVAEINPHSEADALVFGGIGIPVDHPALDLYSTADRLHDTAEFHQHAVASVLCDAPTMLLDLRIDQLLEMRLEPLVGALLVLAHQARVARHIGGENGGQPAFDASRGQGGAPGTAWAD